MKGARNKRTSNPLDETCLRCPWIQKHARYIALLADLTQQRPATK